MPSTATKASLFFYTLLLCTLVGLWLGEVSQLEEEVVTRAFLREIVGCRHSLPCVRGVVAHYGPSSFEWLVWHHLRECATPGGFAMYLSSWFVVFLSSLVYLACVGEEEEASAFLLVYLLATLVVMGSMRVPLLLECYDTYTAAPYVQWTLAKMEEEVGWRRDIS